jgi:hypothetical protein
MALGRKTGGRQRGSKNKRTLAAAAATTDVILTGLTPLEFMLETMRNPKLEHTVRMDAAKAAAPYIHSKLVATDNASRNQDPYAGKSVQELNALFLEALAERGLMLVPIPEEPEPPKGIAPPRGSNGSGNGSDH